MRKNIFWAVMVIAAALIQTTWLDLVRLQGVLPDLPLLLVVYFALTEGEERAMLTGVLAGVYQDVASNAILGHHILCNVVVGYIAGRVATRLIIEHPAVKAGMVLCASLLHGVIYSAISYVQNPDVGIIAPLATSVVPGAFYTALATPIVFFVCSRFFHGNELVMTEAP